ncbi:hypothetical protein [Parasitella parasitica]|uniref:THUMP domain-containing protein n=1 Tax=Parasitella parasitica TaxID=35722 RepID=A0A0B7NHA3_9FUNG|nr:hypothetical protein [Parasitella parasitica]
MPEQTVEKRPAQDVKHNKTVKKQKKGSDTIPILRGRFKQRWLTKHSHLLKRSDDASGILVSCSVNAETRALGQVSTCLEHYITKLFPDHTSTWARFEGKLDIDQADFDEQEEEGEDQKENEKSIEKEHYIKQLPDKERGQELGKLRHCSRWIPLDYICPAITERIGSCFERVKADYFDTKGEATDETVAIITEIRNNVMINKEEVIQTIAPLIPPKYK